MPTFGNQGEPPPDDFLHGAEHHFSSSNVDTGKYDAGEHYLELGFKGGKHYGYHDVSPIEAMSLAHSGSPGGWVWDHLRRRGTMYGYQKPYAFISGASTGAAPHYYANDEDREWHRRIGPSGRDLEWSDFTHRKVPMATRQPNIPMATHAGSPIMNFLGSLGKKVWSLFQHKAGGGLIHQLRGSGGDDEPIMATPGEYVETVAERQRIDALLGRNSSVMSANQPGHYALGGLVESFGHAATRHLSATIGGAVGAKLGFGGGAIAGALGGLFGAGVGNKLGGGSDGVGAKSPLNDAAEMLKDAARHLSDAATQMTGQGPAYGSSLSSHKWIKNLQGVPQLFGPGNMPPTATAAGGEAGAMGGGLALAGGAAAIALIGVGIAAGKVKDGLDYLTAMVMDPKSVLGALASPYASQVGAFNPATIERFQFALDNVSASIGYVFQPIIQNLTGFADELNILTTAAAPDLREAIVEILPPMREFGREVMTGFVGMLREMSIEFRPALSELGPIARMAGVSIRELFGAVGPFISMVGRLDSQLGSTVSALRSLATETIVFAGLVRDASNRISSMLPQSGGGMFGLAGGIFSGGNTTSALSLLAGGPSLAERRAQAQAMLASSSGPSGAMTFAAQPARHLGIEEVGLEARQKAFSMGADMQERQLAANQSTADNTAAIARLLNMTIPQLLARIAAQQIADNRG